MRPILDLCGGLFGPLTSLGGQKITEDLILRCAERVGLWNAAFHIETIKIPK